ncbi:hypothetical protein [Bacteroides sp. CACC 737]|uniref:hypothetical protein n=1 Tax=Bacteroides sp. CACC 737 TaxID=2755405 RepID=UPI0015EEF363|nr:hypothetical protein [Bacteroides sp. CACC 737]QMI81269.1 hypothetical protein H1A11_05210 [Bacteroides sp. CACC 737]
MKILLSVSFFLAYSNTQAQEGTFFSIPEEQPEFPGGMAACMRFISSNINYSLFDSIPDNIEGRSVVAFRLDIVKKEIFEQNLANIYLVCA